MSNMKPLRNWSLTFIAIASLGYGLYHYKSTEIAESMAQTMPEYPEPVDSISIQLSKYKEHVIVPAEVVAPNSLMLTNELSGKISRINLQSGSMVQKGQLLIQLDISEELASLKTANAKAELAQNELARTQSLYKKKLTSEKALDQAKADSQISQAEVDRIQAIINKKTVRAPFDGVVGLHHLSIGEYLAPNTKITSLIAEQDHLWIDINLSQTQSEQLNGDEVQLILPNNSNNFNAKIIAKEPSIDTSSRSVKYRAELLKTSDFSLVPGAFLEVKIKQGSALDSARP